MVPATSSLKLGCLPSTWTTWEEKETQDPPEHLAVDEPYQCSEAHSAPAEVEDWCIASLPLFALQVVRSCFPQSKIFCHVATVGFSGTLEIQFTYLIPVTSGQGGHGTSSCSRTGRNRRLRAMLAERDAKTGRVGIQIADVGTFWRWSFVILTRGSWRKVGRKGVETDGCSGAVVWYLVVVRVVRFVILVWSYCCWWCGWWKIRTDCDRFW